MSRGSGIANAAAILAQTRQNTKSSMSPKDREELAYRSSIGRSLRKANPVKGPTSGADIYTNKDKVELKLAFLVLTYLYSQDDQKLSKKELKDIKSTISKEAPEFSSADLMEVYGFFNMLPDVNYVLKYVVENNIDDSSFYAANDLVLSNFKSKKVYVNLLKDLRLKYKQLLLMSN